MLSKLSVGLGYTLTWLVYTSVQAHFHKTKAKEDKFVLLWTFGFRLVAYTAPLISACWTIPKAALSVLAWTHMLVLTGVLCFEALLPSVLIKSCLNWLRFRRLEHDGYVDTFQIILNTSLNPPAFDLPLQYSAILSNCAVGFLTLYWAPLVSGLAVSVGSVLFWAQKCNLLRRMSLKDEIEPQIDNLASKLVFMLPVCASVSPLCLVDASALHWTGLGISSAVLVLNLLVDNSRFMLRSHLYDDCLGAGRFASTYWTENPLTSLVDEAEMCNIPKSPNPNLQCQFASESAKGS